MLNRKLRNIGLILLGFILLLFLASCEKATETEPQAVESEFENGTYTGFSDATDQGYAWAKVTIEGDEIKGVELMEITSRGNEKDYQTYQYEPAVKAYQEMPERFEEENSAKVDSYTGATHSSEKFKVAVSRALDYARGGESGLYYDGKFQGESERTEYGYAIALVTIKDDKMNNVELEETDGEGELKDYSTYQYEPAVEAYEEMPERFVENNSIEVDLYSKATQSSIRYVEAVENALRHARKDPDKEIE